MHKFLGEAKGTLYYSNFPNVFDQFMVNKNMLTTSHSFHLVEKSGNDYDVNIEMFDEMKSGGDYPDPIRFGRPSSPSTFKENGYSDHYPISIKIKG
jgi:hypothetical protein